MTKRKRVVTQRTPSIEETAVEMNYHDLRRLGEAQELIRAQGGNIYYQEYVTIRTDQSLEVERDGWGAIYYPNGIIEIEGTPYQQQSFGQPRYVDVFPESIRWLAYKGRVSEHEYRKEYLQIIGSDVIPRFYLLPPKEPSWLHEPIQKLTLQPHSVKGYVPEIVIPDFHISIDRKLMNAGRKKWQPFMEWVDVMWDLLPSNKVQNPSSPLPEHDKPETWHGYVQARKANGWPQADLLNTTIDKRILEDDLPYKIARVPETTHCTSDHWSWLLIQQLRQRHRLDDIPMWVPPTPRK